MGPTRRPIRLPKITKYSVAVTTEGTSVWPQMRTMRPYSRITIVFKPTQRTLASGRFAEMLGTLDIAAPILDHTHEDLLEAIDLVAHAQDRYTQARELLEQLIEILLLGYIGLERIFIDAAHGEVRDRRRLENRAARVEHESLGIEPAQQIAHAIALDDAALVDDRDVAAQALGLFQVVRGQDDRSAPGIDVAQKIPHRAPYLDIHARSRLIEDQQARLVHERARDHEPSLHAAREPARGTVPLVPELQLPQIALGTRSRLGTLDAVEAGLVHHDGHRALELVEVQLLRHHADARLGQLELTVDIEAEDAGGTASLIDQRGHNTDQGRLAGAIGAQQREEIALLDVQIDATQRLDAVFIGLGEG